MFNENLKSIRKAKGFSQEELAIRLNVVRQTISKWEKGYSVPDASMLILIAEIFEITVSELLGAKLDNASDVNNIAEQLSRINEQLAIKNRRSRRILRVIIGVIIAIIAINIILIIINAVAFNGFKTDITQSEIIIYE